MNKLYYPDSRPEVEQARQRFVAASEDALPDGFDHDNDAETYTSAEMDSSWEDYYEIFHSEPDPPEAS